MNSEPETFELTLFDMLAEAGNPGQAACWITLILVLIGAHGIKCRFNGSRCRSFTLLALLPGATGVYGADHLSATFMTDTGHYRPEGLKVFLFSGEATMPIMVGCCGSCALMLIASILWIRSKDEGE